MKTRTGLHGRHCRATGLRHVATLLAATAWLAGMAQANDIAVANITMLSASGGQCPVQFDLSWKNSWRAKWTEAAPNVIGTDPEIENWDAAWVFLKFRTEGGPWTHATLATNPATHAAPSGATLSVGLNNAKDKGLGVFIHRSADGHGDVNYTGIKLNWRYDADGVNPANPVDLAVHAIEMVYVPEGKFQAGSPGGIGLAGYANWFHANGDPDVPFLVESENAQTIYWTTGQSAALPAEFPKGFNAFYCMKYPITQGQYTDFLNSLTYDQATNRFNGAYTGVTAFSIGLNGTTFTNGAPDRNCNYLSWADLAAYTDWAGLRPMSELEFEKACRGPLHAVAGEYAWGSRMYTLLTSVTGDGTGADVAVPANANFNAGANFPPRRAGIFARANSTRMLSGATYWGILDMSGQPEERPVTVGNATGLLFTGLHGDGQVTVSGGNADVSGWPGTTALGAGVRGNAGNNGNVSFVLTESPVGARAAATVTRMGTWGDSVGRYLSSGGRAVRTAP